MQYAISIDGTGSSLDNKRQQTISVMSDFPKCSFDSLGYCRQQYPETKKRNRRRYIRRNGHNSYPCLYLATSAHHKELRPKTAMARENKRQRGQVSLFFYLWANKNNCEDCNSQSYPDRLSLQVLLKATVLAPISYCSRLKYREPRPLSIILLSFFHPSSPTAFLFQTRLFDIPLATAQKPRSNTTKI